MILKYASVMPKFNTCAGMSKPSVGFFKVYFHSNRFQVGFLTIPLHQMLWFNWKLFAVFISVERRWLLQLNQKGLFTLCPVQLIYLASRIVSECKCSVEDVFSGFFPVQNTIFTFFVYNSVMVDIIWNCKRWEYSKKLLF